MTVEVPEEPARIVTVVGLAETLKLGGLSGLSLVNLTLVGDEVPWRYRRSRVGLVPVALAFNP